MQKQNSVWKAFAYGAQCLILVALSLTMLGCANTKASSGNIGLSLYQAGITSGVGYAIAKNPVAVPGVQSGAEIICSMASGSAVDPNVIKVALDAYGQNSLEAKMALQFALTTYSLAFNHDRTNAPAYLTATCNGLRDALTIYGPASINSPPTAVKGFPQLK